MPPATSSPPEAGEHAVRRRLRIEKIDKVRARSLAEVPELFMVGKRGAEERRVSVRPLGSQSSTELGLEEALALLGDEATAPDVRRGQKAERKTKGAE